eukprot:s5540_g2.t2
MAASSRGSFIHWTRRLWRGPFLAGLAADRALGSARRVLQWLSPPPDHLRQQLQAKGTQPDTRFAFGAVRLIGPDEDLLITGETGACVQRDGDSFVLKEEGLSGIAPGSAGHVALAETLPTSDLAPAQLLSWVRQAVQALQDGGTLLLTSFWGPSGPLQPLLTLPELRLEVGL